jgi:hypothetical protein
MHMLQRRMNASNRNTAARRRCWGWSHKFAFVQALEWL